jgi:hypothetical protein
MSPAASEQTIASKEPSGNSSARVASPDADASGETSRGDEVPSLAHLLAADVHARDPAAVAAGDAQRRRREAATDVQHGRRGAHARQRGDQVSVCVERLAQALPAPREVAEMEAVAVEQAPLVGDQVEIGAHAASAPPAAHQRRQPDRHRRLQLARKARRAGLPPRRHQHPCAQLRSLPTRRLRELRDRHRSNKSLAPQSNSVRLKLLASRASRVGGLRAFGRGLSAGPVETP